MRRYQETQLIPASPEDAFKFVDNHTLFSSHMNQSSWMMGGGQMNTKFDEGHGQKVGSHIRMSGKAFIIPIALDEVVTERESPRLKTWETVGNPKLIIIGHYKMGIVIEPQQNQSRLSVFIEYDLPKKNVWLGRLFGGFYAKWCVQQMIQGTKNYFTKPTHS